MKQMLIYNSRAGRHWKNESCRPRHRSALVPVVLIALALTPLLADAMIVSQESAEAVQPLLTPSTRAGIAPPKIPAKQFAAENRPNVRRKPGTEQYNPPRASFRAKEIKVGSAPRPLTLAAKISEEAQKYVGTRYVWGGKSPAGFDCSGLVYYLYADHGIELPRRARDMFRAAQPLKRAELRLGDLVFFRNPDHVGIYLGDGRFIHASSGKRKVAITPLDHPSYQQRFLGAGRVIAGEAPG